MTHDTASPGGKLRPRKAGLAISLTIVALLIATVWAYYSYLPAQAGPVQPIAFSHRLHATTRQISCVFCHTGAIDTPRAGVPPLDRCMLCHERIIVDHPEIRKLREHFASGRPVEWVRVNDLPEFAYFTHNAHIFRAVDCGECHGDIASMDRVYLRQKLQMGFCVTCHKARGVSHDCFTCHR